MTRTVLITGTSTGIGAACVARMAADGWTVFAGVRKVEDGDHLKTTISGDVRPVILDVTSADQIAAVVASLTEELGVRGLDALVNNAGVAEGGPFESLSSEAWRWHFDVNVFGLVDTTRELLPLLRTASGRIVNIGSVAGRTSAPGMAPYGAGKHAVEAISESLRAELAPFDMHVSCVEPGEIKTAIWDKGTDKLAEAEAAAEPEMIERYEPVVNAMYGFVAHGAEKGIPATDVADAIHHALTAVRPKDRYLVGTDAKVIGIVTRMPDRLRRRILGLLAKPYERSGRKLRAEALARR